MKKVNYYSSVCTIDDERYLMIFLVGSDFLNKDMLIDIKELARNLSTDPESNVIYDFLYRNGHQNYIFNRFFLVNTQYHAKDLSNYTSIIDINDMFKIGNFCNNWWIMNFDLLNEFDQSERYLERLKNTNFKLTWIR